MAYQYKSKAMQELAKRNAQKQQEALSALVREAQRVRETVQILAGERGSNRAIRQSDLRGAKQHTMKAQYLDPDGPGSVVAEYNKLREDVAALFTLLSKIAG